MRPIPKLINRITPALPPPLKAGGYSRKTKGWESMGIREKPTTCGMCAYSQVGTAFVPDFVPPDAALAFVFAHPRKDDVIEQRPLSGPFGAVLKELLIHNFGRELREVAVVHGIRCMPKKINTRNGPAFQYPTGFLQRAAESNCRQYDDSCSADGLLAQTGIISWKPTMFLTTLDIDTMLDVGAFKFMIQRDVRKAWAFADQGEKVAVLFGSEVLSLVAGNLKGGSKAWRGHFWETDGWPFETKIRKEGFS